MISGNVGVTKSKVVVFKSITYEIACQEQSTAFGA